MSIESLGDDVLLGHVFPLLDLSDLLTISVVSKYLHQLTQVSTVWHQLYIHTFATLPPQDAFRKSSDVIDWKELFKQRMQSSLYTWGDVSRGRLGYNMAEIPENERSTMGFGVPAPHNVKTVESYSIARIQGGGYFFVFSTIDGGLYTIGTLSVNPRPRPMALVQIRPVADPNTAVIGTDANIDTNHGVNTANTTAREHHNGPTPGPSAPEPTSQEHPANSEQPPQDQNPSGTVLMPLHRVPGSANALQPRGPAIPPPRPQANQAPQSEYHQETAENQTLPEGVVRVPIRRVHGPIRPHGPVIHPARPITTRNPDQSPLNTPPVTTTDDMAPAPHTTEPIIPPGVVVVPTHRVGGPLFPRSQLNPPSNHPQQLAYTKDSPVKFVDFSAGREHVVALDDRNGIYIWDTSFSKPAVKLAFARHPDIGNVTAILAAWNYAAVATSKAGVLLIYDIGQLQGPPTHGNGQEHGYEHVKVVENYVCVPHTTFFKKRELEIVSMAGGTSFLVMVNRRGQVLYVKDADDGSKVLSQKPQILEHFTQILEGTSDTFCKVYGSYQHFAVLSEGGKVVFGHCNDPSKVIEYSELNDIIDIAIGDHHFFALDSHGKVFTWGLDLGHKGVLGLGPFDRSGNLENFTPEHDDIVSIDASRRNFKLNRPVLLANIDKPAFTVAAGGAHSAALF